MQKSIKIFTTPTCAYCRMAKELFKQNNITYEEKDVTTDIQARDEMINKSGQMGVPVIFVGDDIVVGFDKRRLSELLGVK
ncbi:MAG: glutaredoxin domain-containing protein [Patescibacteria group bacterium]